MKLPPRILAVAPRVADSNPLLTPRRRRRKAKRLAAGELRRHFIRRCQSTHPLDARTTCTPPVSPRYLVLMLTAEIVGVGQCIVTCSCCQAVHDAPEPSHEIDNADVSALFLSLLPHDR